MAENYKVGQVLFVIPADNATVVAVQVMERRISETAGGIVVRHIIKSTKPAAKPLVLETVKGSIYTDLKHVREVMIRNATGAIDGMIKHAAAVAQEAFAPPSRKQQQPMPDDLDPLGSADVFVDDDSDVQQDSMQHPVQMLPAPRAPTQSNEHMSLPPDIEQDGTTEIMLPDGSMQRVKVKLGGPSKK